MLNEAKFFEATNEDPETPIMTTQVAGLQFYDFGKKRLSGKVKPAQHERVNLIRKPDNQEDQNAIEVWSYNSEHMLGHIPRDLAEDLAPIIDEGRHIRGYVIDPGTPGITWSMDLVLASDHLPKHLISAHFEKSLRELNRFVEEKRKPQKAKPIALPFTFEFEERAREAAEILAIMFVTKEDIEPPFPEDPGPEVEGKSYCSWPSIPDGLKTKTQWSNAGFKLKKDAKKPRAEYYTSYGYKEWRYDLWAVDQVERKKVRPQTVARRMLEQN